MESFKEKIPRVSTSAPKRLDYRGELVAILKPGSLELP